MSTEPEERLRSPTTTSTANDGDLEESVSSRHRGASTMPTSDLILCSMLMKKSPKGIAGLKAWQARYFMLFEERIVYKKDALPSSGILGKPIQQLSHASVDSRAPCSLFTRAFPVV
jgi:hypothetical protein